MPSMFTRNSESAPIIMGVESHATPIPMAESGGSNATEMAIPGSVSDSFGLTIASFKIDNYSNRKLVQKFLYKLRKNYKVKYFREKGVWYWLGNEYWLGK